MDHEVRVDVETSMRAIDVAEWGRLEAGRNLYQSHPWLSWAEGNCAASAAYLLARTPAGRLVGALPAYVLRAGSTSWNAWYDPLRVFVDEDAARHRRPGWFPLLALGSVSGYHSDVLVDASLHEGYGEAVTRALLRRAASLAADRAAQSMAMMYVPAESASRLARAGLCPTSPVATSAAASLHASWQHLEDYVSSFPSRRRYNIRREIDVFRGSGSRIVTARLSDCLEDVGPLLGNLHRKHGALDDDLTTTAYLASQAEHLDGLSTVFLEYAGGTVTGFSLCYQWGRVLYVRVVGFDYTRTSPFAYFNLAYYLPLEHAIRHGLSCVELGPGTYEAKARRGAVLSPTRSLVWPPECDQVWFDRVRQPGDDAREAAPWLPGGAPGDVSERRSVYRRQEALADPTGR